MNCSNYPESTALANIVQLTGMPFVKPGFRRGVLAHLGITMPRGCGVIMSDYEDESDEGESDVVTLCSSKDMCDDCDEKQEISDALRRIIPDGWCIRDEDSALFVLEIENTNKISPGKQIRLANLFDALDRISFSPMQVSLVTSDRWGRSYAEHDLFEVLYGKGSL